MESGQEPHLWFAGSNRFAHTAEAGAFYPSPIHPESADATRFIERGDV